MKHRRAAAGILVLACGCGSGASGYRGKIFADGRDFGTHRVEERSYSGTCAWRRYGPEDNPTSSPIRPAPRSNDDKVTLMFELSRAWHPQGRGYLELSPDEHPARVDLRLPWSHVAFTQANCEEFQLQVERTGSEGWLRGRVRLRCTLPDRADVLDVDAAFEGC